MRNLNHTKAGDGPLKGNFTRPSKKSSNEGQSEMHINVIYLSDLVRGLSKYYAKNSCIIVTTKLLSDEK